VSHQPRCILCALIATFFAAVVAMSATRVGAEEFADHKFNRQELSDVYYSEGIGAGDLNGDGQEDIIYGPYWFAGPDFKTKHELYPPKPQNRDRYADHFFAWVYDFNGDGRNDILTAGFPGTPGFVYENPGPDGYDKHWKKHTVVDSVANESPQFVNIVGDEKPELVCSNHGFFGYVTWDPAKPFEPWKFTAVSEKIAPDPFGHGLGIGDVNGDGRQDIIVQNGWFEQPKSLEGSPRWKLHAAKFAPAGGAEMYVYDVDGDGDNDVITSLAAHEFGLAWYEQVKDGDEIAFKQHLIMGKEPSENRYGLIFSELHSVNLADIDGDGLKDIVTGKTYRSHHNRSPMWDAGPVVYWFRLQRTPDGVDWVPYKADDVSGIGRQLVVHDINKDGLPDLASGGMTGAHVLIHKKDKISKEKFEELKPKANGPIPKPQARGREPRFPEKGNQVAGALEGETFKVAKASAGKPGTQKMNGFSGDRWSGDNQLFWTGARPGDRIDLELPVEKEGNYDVIANLTMAPNYAKVQLSLDDEPIGDAIDLYEGDVVTTGELTLSTRNLTAGPHKLSIEIKGANPAARKDFMVGLDYLRLDGK